MAEGEAVPEGQSVTSQWENNPQRRLVPGTVARSEVEKLLGYAPDAARDWLLQQVREGRVRAWRGEHTFWQKDHPVCLINMRPIQEKDFHFKRFKRLELANISFDEKDLEHSIASKLANSGNGANFHDGNWVEWPLTPAAESNELRNNNPETLCREWLAKCMRQSPERSPKKKSEWQNESMKKFPGLEKRAFDRAWGNAKKDAGASKWGSPGRKSSR